ncbi:Rho guanine nucleotide exchange factor (GEF) 17 [Balamuthia mandrillaris]
MELEPWLKELGLQDLLPSLQENGIHKVSDLDGKDKEQLRRCGIALGDCLFLIDSFAGWKKQNDIEAKEEVVTPTEEEVEKEEQEQKEQLEREHETAEKEEVQLPAQEEPKEDDDSETSKDGSLTPASEECLSPLMGGEMRGGKRTRNQRRRERRRRLRQEALMKAAANSNPGSGVVVFAVDSPVSASDSESDAELMSDSSRAEEQREKEEEEQEEKNREEGEEKDIRAENESEQGKEAKEKENEGTKASQQQEVKEQTEEHSNESKQNEEKLDSIPSDTPEQLEKETTENDILTENIDNSERAVQGNEKEEQQEEMTALKEEEEETEKESKTGEQEANNAALVPKEGGEHQDKTDQLVDLPRSRAHTADLTTALRLRRLPSLLSEEEIMASDSVLALLSPRGEKANKTNNLKSNGDVLPSTSSSTPNLNKAGVGFMFDFGPSLENKETNTIKKDNINNAAPITPMINKSLMSKSGDLTLSRKSRRKTVGDGWLKEELQKEMTLLQRVESTANIMALLYRRWQPDSVTAKDLKKVILAQAVVRRFLVKKALKRMRIASELLVTEQNYVGHLSTIIRIFLEPLEQQAVPKKWVTMPEIRTMFSVVRQLHKHHTRFLEVLEQRMKNWDVFKKHGVADLFLQFDFVFLYSHYVDNYGNALDTLDRCKKNPSFSTFLKKCEAKPECNYQDLPSFLIMPVQRVPRYEMLLRDLIKKSTSGTESYRMLDSAYTRIRQVTREINERKRVSEQLAVVQRFFDQRLVFANNSKHVEELPWSRKRRLVYEGPVGKGHPSKKHLLSSATIGGTEKDKEKVKETSPSSSSLSDHLVLFNDALLLCIPSSSSHNHWNKLDFLKGTRAKSNKKEETKLHVKEVIPVTDLNMITLADARDSKCRVFRFQTNKKKKYEFFTKSASEAKRWVSELSTLLSEALTEQDGVQQKQQLPQPQQKPQLQQRPVRRQSDKQRRKSSNKNKKEKSKAENEEKEEEEQDEIITIEPDVDSSNSNEEDSSINDGDEEDNMFSFG